MRTFVYFTFILSGILTGCSSLNKPCTDGGDITWESPTHPHGKKFGGDKKCEQTRGGDGLYYNNGGYREFYPNGKLALEGQYMDGQKDGVWTEYSSTGEKLFSRTYQKGVEILSQSLVKPKGAK